MKKIIVFGGIVLTGLLVVSLTGIPLQGAIPPSERAALIALYNATNGDNWYVNTGWKTEPLESDGFGPIGSEGTWKGITVSGDHVTKIFIYQLFLSGNIPPELGDLGHLKSLVLTYNDLSGNIPPELGNLGSLEMLALSGNKLTGSIPPEFENLDNLNRIFIDDNQLTTIPPELGNLDNLERLDLRKNQITAIPSELENLTNLTHLFLNINQLTSLPPELGNMSNLQTLYISHNQLTSLPPELGNLDNLEHFELGNNQLTSIPPELGNLDNLEVLELGNNQLTTIPPELGDLDNLEVLELGNNQLATIPPELGNLDNLKWLYLNDNQLTSIPSELGNLNNLYCLYLSGNQLTYIPPELWNLNSLHRLWLCNNQLTGSIPSELGNLSNLESLNLSSNQLTGSIPSSITNLTGLSVYDTYLGYNGLYTNDDVVRAFLNSIDADWEETQTIAPSNVSAAAISTSSIRVSWTPITYTGDTGGYKVYYSTTSGGPYTYSGMTTDKSISSYDVTGLSSSTTYYMVVKTQTDSHSNNGNTVVSEHSEEVSAATASPLEEKNPPFGSFDTPIHGSTVFSSIPVTGWALDDTGIYGVKIYRAQGNSLVYIGDATMVEGARPDVAQLYPEYPNNTRAGWGYMMLTNFLPNSGNGTFVIHAIATDLVGKTTTLGTKTMHCDNANAVKPFGAIDTPTQGGAASGSSFINWGWALTPQPNYIPTDGSTIHVYVDGVNLGHPIYNIYRSDIATLFPGYANSGGAIGYFYLDTTVYTNGVHIIQWTAADSGGNADGIGSRYFAIQNSHGARRMAHGVGLPRPGAIPNVSNIPIDDSLPVRVKKGFNRNVKPFEIYPDDNGIITVEIAEVERIEVRLFPEGTAVPGSMVTGYQVTGNQLTPLPIGSTLDAGRGIFCWMPGPGFIGEYQLVFIVKGPGGDMIRRNMIVTIIPKFTNMDDTHTD